MREEGETPEPPSAAEEAAARDERIAFFEQRAAADPLDFASLNTLSGEYLQRARETGDVADYQRAEIAAQRSLELIPGDSFAGLIRLASVRFVQHDYTAVESLALQAQALRPGNAAPYGMLADSQIGLGRYDEADRSLQRMLELDAGLPALSRRANLAFLRGDRFNAVDFWKQAIRAGEGQPAENQAWAHVQLGVTYFALGDLSRAESEHERALKLYPEYVHALAGLAQVRAAQQRYEEAIDLYTHAVARQPQPQYVAALGDVLAAAGRGAEAEEQYALVDAIAALYEANGIDTDLQIALFFASHDRELTAALEMAEAAYDAAPNVYAADALAWALYKNGRYAEASRYAAEASARGTLEASFYFHAALIDSALGNDDSAFLHIKTALDLNPRFSPLHADEARGLFSRLEASR
jgi:tetratricopeptide (TPR) repeat protein